MELMTEPEQLVAVQLFQVGAVKFGAFKLKLHETKPDAPLSPIYLNLRTAANPKPGPLTPELVRMAGDLLYDLACRNMLSYDHVAGVPNAGDPFARAFIECSADRINLLRLKKEGGPEHRRVVGVRDDGFHKENDSVLLIDDLITKADSKLEAIAAIKEERLRVRHVLVLVDREQGGAEELAKEQCKVHAVFTLSQLLAFYLAKGLLEQPKYDEVTAYLAANR